MSKFVRMIVVGAVASLLYPIVCVCFGALSGWAVGLTFGDAIRATLGAYGLNPPVTFWEMGATLGFIGGYFKSVHAGGK